jgi:hypothetical protein
MSRSASREEVEAWRPGRVRVGSWIAIGITGPDRGDRPPEDIPVLAIPTSDGGVRQRLVECEKLATGCRSKERRQPISSNQCKPKSEPVAQKGKVA